MMTKRAFAARCRVSAPTLYKWIKQNKDGICAYCTDDGISDAILDAEPWQTLCAGITSSEPKTYSKAMETRKALEDAQLQIAKLSEDLTRLENENVQLQRVNNLLENQIAVKDQQIQALQVLMKQQLQALPAPRKTLRERWEERKQRKQTAREAASAAAAAANTQPPIDV